MPSTFTVKGKVTDSTTHKGIANADVRIIGGSPFGKKVVTDSAGRYKISGVAAGKTILEASLGYAPNDKMVTVSGTTTVDFKLKKQ
jgi:hypothetical protein